MSEPRKKLIKGAKMPVRVRFEGPSFSVEITESGPIAHGKISVDELEETMAFFDAVNNMRRKE